jgi:hypothetical protein
MWTIFLLEVIFDRLSSRIFSSDHVLKSLQHIISELDNRIERLELDEILMIVDAHF